ncbi:ARM repeat-containing protein [Macrolepiota fuliginosa MF-IS2]|uniref:ARM repeat-containing protein n=1 Tax=Macrolepiota fuliginosa MF-IS2 TaxID=1400762 RepID=A0A9P5X785_9AGAR|nr:ARM repeat-containing protein [Macrolepiota fuliginosa MF-IS2]
MDPVVPPEITAELTQILSNLVQGDNEIRQNAEQAVNERLAQTPEQYLLALAQFAIIAELDVMRSFSLVLLRRLLFRVSPSPSQQHQPRLTLYDHLSSNTLTTLQRLLLHSLTHELSQDVRKKAVDTITDLANQEMARGRPWHALQSQAFAMTQYQAADRGVPPAALRESAFRVFAGCPNLVVDLQTDAVLGVFQKGLQDSESVAVRHAALLAAVGYLTAADPQQLSRSLALMNPMLETIHVLSQSLSQPSTTPKPVYQQLTQFLTTLTPLCSSHPTLFAPHLQSLLSFFPQLILPAVDSGPTPTMTRPFPSSASRQDAFVFPPPGTPTSAPEPEIDDEAEARSTMRLTALEFMISLSEARPSMVRKAENWVAVMIRACLEGMSELDEDEDVSVWLKDDPSTGSGTSDDSPPSLYEQSLDRIACALGGRAVLPPAFHQIPSMLADYDWRARHAGLIAIASIAEGTGKVMLNELGKIVDLVTPMFRDSHPRVRHAACQCVGQLCTDLEEVMQERYHQQLFSVLIPTLEDPEPRVHSHAAAALINFCEGVEHDTLIPYLDPIVERLLRLLNPGGDESQVHRYVQEQAITTLAMVADASEATFAKHYPTIMPLLLNVLRNADKPEHQRLRIKAMECAGLVAIAVGREIFRPDSAPLIELLIRIQKSPLDPNDTQLTYYLISTWAKIGQALGTEFEPYLPLVMPSILKTASSKTDISVYDDDDDSNTERDGWETVQVDGRTMGIKTSALEEKCQAFETLLIYCSTLGGKYAPYLTPTLEICIPCLKFDFHEGVREASAMLVPRLLDSGKISNTLSPQMVTATFNQLISCIRSEPDSSFLASLYKCFTESLQVIGGPSYLPQEYHVGIIEATKQQLQALADKRKSRANRLAGDPDVDKDDIALYEQFEEFALQEMDKLLTDLDRNHPLRIAVSSVRDLGVNDWDADEGEEVA